MSTKENLTGCPICNPHDCGGCSQHGRYDIPPEQAYARLKKKPRTLVRTLDVGADGLHVSKAANAQTEEIPVTVLTDMGGQSEQNPVPSVEDTQPIDGLTISIFEAVDGAETIDELIKAFESIVSANRVNGKFEQQVETMTKKDKQVKTLNELLENLKKMHSLVQDRKVVFMANPQLFRKLMMSLSIHGDTIPEILLGGLASRIGHDKAKQLKFGEKVAILMAKSIGLDLQIQGELNFNFNRK